MCYIGFIIFITKKFEVSLDLMIYNYISHIISHHNKLCWLINIIIILLLYSTNESIINNNSTCVPKFTTKILKFR